jgi:hypothetical protein
MTAHGVSVDCRVLLVNLLQAAPPVDTPWIASIENVHLSPASRRFQKHSRSHCTPLTNAGSATYFHAHKTLAQLQVEVSKPSSQHPDEGLVHIGVQIAAGAAPDVDVRSHHLPHFTLCAQRNFQPSLYGTYVPSCGSGTLNSLMIHEFSEPGLTSPICCHDWSRIAHPPRSLYLKNDERVMTTAWWLRSPSA